MFRYRSSISTSHLGQPLAATGLFGFAQEIGSLAKRLDPKRSEPVNHSLGHLWRKIGQWAEMKVPNTVWGPLTAKMVALSPRLDNVEAIQREELRPLHQHLLALEEAVKYRALRMELRRKGFIQDDGSVRALMSKNNRIDFRDVIEFVDVLVVNLPEEWDLIDAFKRLDFGPWHETKGVRDTFRSMVQRDDEGNGRYQAVAKTDALKHPLGDRAQMLIFINRDITNGNNVEDVIQDYEDRNPGFDINIIVSRLVGEIRVIEYFLARQAWLKHLNPDIDDEEMPAHFRGLAVKANRTKEEIAKLVQYLVSDKSLMAKLLEALKKPISI